MTQTRNRKPPKTLPLLLLLILPLASRTVGVALSNTNSAQAAQRFFYASGPASGSGSAAAESTQTKVRLLRQVDGAAAPAEEGSCCQGASSTPSDSSLLPLEGVSSSELGNVTAVDYDVSGEASSKENVKRHVPRAAIRFASAASCSPQPTIVELKPPGAESSNFFYTPACTRVNRCSGCCGSTLITCQPTETEIVQMRVWRGDRSGAEPRRKVTIVDVEQHLACRCGCRIKEGDCNAYQSYRQELCRCECHNTDAKDKCLEQLDVKYWDDANCTCACRYNLSCTTGTVFDETQCKCTDPMAPVDVLDRKRFIVQAISVETDNTTLYSV
ncbi:uncharacterized protein Dana_GF19053, isoform B [Drosophila ananassae]|uniref:Uncharacterized protein, isoform B n=1 Tax=Drosophila ananassae TaxID=7217 RepID=B3MZW0_DROAN|nr:uncharacterized protein LOC6501817 isoform X1 [Drosophila ananassae]EDV33911.1 uncharacterized protein Dana_GF19053, isoform C [Drosophila ananassae]KPU74835.1 uncharacterized protein Dana_GF19053, isoform B [Drosophila ananassae]